MKALEIKRNGTLLAVVGTPNALMFTINIFVSVEEHGGKLDIRGMNDLGNDRTSHTTWLELDSMNYGEILEIRFVETEISTVPVCEIATDAEEFIANQVEYEQQCLSEPFVPRLLAQKQPNASLKLTFADRQLIVATFESGREFLSCRFFWSQWNSECCRVSLSSFSQQEALARMGSREWYSGVLQQGESCVVEVEA